MSCLPNVGTHSRICPVPLFRLFQAAGDLFCEKGSPPPAGIIFRPRRRCFPRRAEWSRRVRSRRQSMRTLDRRAHHHLPAAGADLRQSRNKSPYLHSATEAQFKQDQFSTPPRCWSPGFSRSSVLRPEGPAKVGTLRGGLHRIASAGSFLGHPGFQIIPHQSQGLAQFDVDRDAVVVF